MKVYKFGGASVKDANGVKQVVNILKLAGEEPLVVVLSAMGKTTNALEQVWSVISVMTPIVRPIYLKFLICI